MKGQGARVVSVHTRTSKETSRRREKNKRRCVSPRCLPERIPSDSIYTILWDDVERLVEPRFILKYETERCSTSEEFASSSSGEIRIDRAGGESSLHSPSLPPSNRRSFKLFSSASEPDPDPRYATANVARIPGRTAAAKAS